MTRPSIRPIIHPWMASYREENLLCSHSEHQNNPFQSKHFHQKNRFTKYETNSKSWIECDSPWAQQTCKYEQDIFHRPSASAQPPQGPFKLKMRSNKMSNKPVNMNKLPSTDLVQVLNRLNDFCSPQAQI